MTPQRNRQPASAQLLDMHLISAPHLTSDQMSDLLACASSPCGENLHLEAEAEATATARAQAHLNACAACAAEYTSLREAISLFQEASVAHADREYGLLRTLSRPAFPVLPPQRAYPQTLFWMAASIVLMAGILPLEMRWQRTASTPPTAVAVASVHTAESDEALLEDIDRELSASVPTPMQALADPTGDAAQTSVPANSQTAPQEEN